jgi:DNA-directed RNA polymerase subunit RPC12/RpoP
MQEKPEFKAKEEQRINYDTIAFILKQPYTNIVVKGPLRLHSRNEHRALIDEAKKKGLHVWLSRVVKTADNKYVAVQPHIIDWDCLPDQTTDAEPERHPGDMRCPKCGHQCSSTSGLTLHMKAHARDDEIADIATPSLKCKHCGKKCSSTSGLTLHMKQHK